MPFTKGSMISELNQSDLPACTGLFIEISKVTLLALRDSSAEGFYLKNGYGNRDFLTFMRENLV